MKRHLSKWLNGLGYRFSKYSWEQFGDGTELQKGELLLERAREVVSDPLNLLIRRVPNAGYVDADQHVILHNGNRVPVTGPYAYYGDFSDLLVINRGVHEPLEEFCFQNVVGEISTDEPTMIELGAYWAHYSMWLKRVFPKARCILVEPERENLDSGRNNFKTNGFQGTFVEAMVAPGAFEVDKYLTEQGIEALDILHADIQGFELGMLEKASQTLSRHRINFVFISTHSDDLHHGVVATLTEHGYRIEAESSFEHHTTSCDGFVLASSPNIPPVFKEFAPWGRLEIAHAEPRELLKMLIDVQASARHADGKST